MMKDHLCDNCGRLEYLHGPWCYHKLGTLSCKEFRSKHYPFFRYNYVHYTGSINTDPIVEYENQM